jgi:DNA ligase (NAD+)
MPPRPLRNAAIAVANLSSGQAADAHADLAAAIRHYGEKYHADDAPEISDADYDALFQRLQAIEARFPRLADAESPTHKVGAAPAEGFAKVRHAVPMLSLGNCFTAPIS